VIVTVALPVAAELEAVNVTTSPLKLAVTPDGKPLAANVTVPLKPPVGVTVIVLVPVPPCVTLAAVAESEKLADGFTVRVSVAVLLRVPLVPVIVTVAAPVVALLEAVNVTTSPLKLAVTPDGKPLAVNVTVPVKPPVGVTVIVLVPVPPCVTVAGVANNEKPGELDVAMSPTMIPRPFVQKYTRP
jgi:hypothetical protein